jgi:hypothetical protein
MKDKILNIYDDYIKEFLSAPVMPAIIGVLNLVFAESLAGITLGVLLILVGVSEYIEQKDK